MWGNQGASARRRLPPRRPPRIQEPQPRNGLLLRLFFGRVLGRDQCVALLRDARDRSQAQLGEYEGLLAHLTATEGHLPDFPYMRLTLLAGIHQCRASLAWAEECLNDLAGDDTP